MRGGVSILAKLVLPAAVSESSIQTPVQIHEWQVRDTNKSRGQYGSLRNAQVCRAGIHFWRRVATEGRLYAKNMMARKVFIVSDAGVIAAGWLKDVQSDLAELGIESVVFKELTPQSQRLRSDGRRRTLCAGAL